MQVSANGIRLEVEDHGSPQGEPLLLVMGLGMQLLGCAGCGEITRGHVQQGPPPG